MRASIATVLLGSLALAIASNSTVNDTSLSSSQRVEVRKVVLPFQPSPSDEQDSQEEPISGKLKASQSPSSESEELPGQGSERRERINFENAKDSGNNTIDTAGTGHYGHISDEFLPVPVVYEVEPHHKPLKPSVVHRDPHAHFDTYDAIRTQDYDRHHQVYPVTPKDGRLEEIGLHEPGHAAYGYGHGHGSYEASKAYPYDMSVIPECAHKNRYYYNLTFCLEDSHYPTETILWAIRQSGGYAENLLSDVTYQSADNLVDGLTRAEEEGYTYQHYFGGSHHQHLHLDKYKPPYQGYSYSPEYYKKGGYICPSDIYYARPRRAMNTYGKWKVIVNLDYIPKELAPVDHGHGHGLGHGQGLGHGHGHGHEYGYQKHQTYTQTLRLEQCIYANAPCSYIDTRVHSSCLQKHNFVRLVAWTYEQGLHVDTFKMPIACSCHIKQPVHFYQPVHHQPHHHEHEHPQLLAPQYILQ